MGAGISKLIFWGPQRHRFMHVCQMGWGLLSNACIIVLTLWTIRRESPFIRAVSDFPQEQKDLRPVSMPTASWVFMRAAGLFWIAMDYQLEMKDSYPNAQIPGTVRAWRFSLCFAFLLFSSALGFCSFVLCLLVWLSYPCTSLTRASWRRAHSRSSKRSERLDTKKKTAAVPLWASAVCRCWGNVGREHREEPCTLLGSSSATSPPCKILPCPNSPADREGKDDMKGRAVK